MFPGMNFALSKMTMVWILSVARQWIGIVERELEKRGIPFLVLQDVEEVDRARWTAIRPQLVFVGQSLKHGEGLSWLIPLRQAFPETQLVFVAHDPSPELERQARQASLLLFGAEPLTPEIVREILDRVFHPHHPVRHP